MNKSSVRTRFAPSPTGYLHIGGARTALFAWLFAKSYKGDCLLRIEDTDKERSKEEYTKEIIRSFEWLGIEFDEEVAYQSKNATRYKEVIDSLLEEGLAYVCSGDDLQDDKKFRDQTLARDVNTVVRFKMPEKGSTKFDDLVKGQIEVSNEELEDFIIERSDGSATYNFCVVVDDWDMKVTHIIRGDDHINNTPRQINLLKALNAYIPQYAHLSMILAADGQKLSKRHGAASVLKFKEQGYLPEAIINYLARLGWSHGDDEIFSAEQLGEWFDFDHITSSSAQFDEEKLDWINNYYIKNTANDKLANLITPRLEGLGVDKIDKDILQKAIDLYKEREKNLNFFANDILFFFTNVNPSKELIDKHLNDESKKLIKLFIDELEDLDWNDNNINNCLKEFVKKQEIKFPEIAMPLRSIIAGTDNTPSIGSIIYILGIDIIKRRVSVFV